MSNQSSTRTTWRLICRSILGLCLALVYLTVYLVLQRALFTAVCVAARFFPQSSSIP